MKTVSTALFDLIKSLNKQEKRYFKIYASRHVIGGENNYLKLFAAIDKQTDYDELKIKKKFASEAFIRQLHVAKNYLYKLILSSLRQFYETTMEDQFPLLMQNARILYKKGLVKQSEKVLQKARKIAEGNEHFLQILEVYRFEHHIIHGLNDFKRLGSYIDVGFQQEMKILDIYKNYLEFQILQDQIFVPYWKKGSIRNPKEQQHIETLFQNEKYHSIENAQSFEARMFFHNARFTYYFLTGQLEKCYKHIQQQVLMFESLEPNQLKGQKTVNYIRSVINLYIIHKQLDKFQEALITLEKLRQIPSKTISEKARLFVRSYNLQTDLYISTGNFSAGIKSMQHFETEFSSYQNYIDNQQRLGLYYNLAYLHFGAADFNRSLDWINLLLNDPDLKTREDIHCFGRILNLFIHFELGNDQLLEYIVKTTFRFLSKRQRLFQVELFILDFLKKYPDWVSHQEIIDGFDELKMKLLPLQKDEYERQAFEYFDFVSWLESKIDKSRFEEIVQGKSLGK